MNDFQWSHNAHAPYDRSLAHMIRLVQTRDRSTIAVLNGCIGWLAVERSTVLKFDVLNVGSCSVTTRGIWSLVHSVVGTIGSIETVRGLPYSLVPSFAHICRKSNS